VRTF